jgi:hypothetical protein
VRERIEEGVREIGMLTVALAPLDAAFAANPRDRIPATLLLLAYGIVFFVAAVILEERRTNG